MADHVSDVLIVGAGHNGLTAANYLLDAGLSVTVVEASSTIGGLSASGRPFPGAPNHVANYGAGDLLFWNASPVASDLNLASYGLKTVPANPSYAYLHPDGSSLVIWQDPKKTAEEIAYFSPSDAKAYLAYAAMLDGLFDVMLPFMLGNLRHPDRRTLGSMSRAAWRHRKKLKQFGSFAFASGEEVIDERFRHPVTRSALHCMAAGASPIENNGTSATGMLLAFLHRVGASRPVGGMQAIPDALATRLRAKGGAILTDTRVGEVVLHDGRATGLRLSNGSELSARVAVLMTCDPHTALGQLLPEGTLSPTLEARVRNIPANVSGAGQMKVDLALSGRLSLTRHQHLRKDDLDLRSPVALIGTEDSNRRAFGRSAAGLLPHTDDIGLWGVITTALDQTQAPAGQDSLYLYVPAVPVTPEEDWKDLTSRAGDAVVERASQFYDGIETMEIGRRIDTPASIAENNNATNGCVLHADVTLMRSGPLRPAIGLGGFSLPVPGLYLGGAGAHPGGGVTGMPGRNAAREILRLNRSKAARN